MKMSKLEAGFFSIGCPFFSCILSLIARAGFIFRWPIHFIEKLCRNIVSAYRSENRAEFADIISANN